MPLTLSVFFLSLFCSWFECEMGPEPPYLYASANNEKKLLSALTGFSEQELDGTNNAIRGPMAYTTLGPVEGYITHTTEGRKIYTFTGIPYGEPPTGERRFRVSFRIVSLTYA